jgi:tetratricopeptide (TPR) repeat protein
MLCGMAMIVAGELGAQQRPLGNPTAPLISRAIDHENGGRYEQARAAWLEVIEAGAVVPGVLGLERIYTMTGEEARLVPLLDSLLPLTPADAQLRGAQLRTLVVLGRDERADSAFREWRALRPRDVTPFRDYARILIFNSRASAADSVIQEATATLGSTRELLLEAAQMRAALGRWREAAEAWRETMRDQPYFESAAVFSLSPAPAEQRDALRAALVTPDAPVGARLALALLELGWGSPLTGWQVLQAMPSSDTTVFVWGEFADEAERVQAWAAARDALVAMQRVRPAAGTAQRGAVAAMRSNDPETALRLVRLARGPLERARPELIGVELEALARLGRGEEAEQVLADAAPQLGAQARGFQRTIAWAWVRSGNVARARAALAEAPLDADDAVAGWLALFDGDLVTARRTLRFGDVSAPEAVSALALLSRTRAERSTQAGDGFLALARGDTSTAVRYFTQAAESLADASSLLVTMAARLETARGADARALPLWTRVAERYAAAPEAPEARLEWGRLLRRRGDVRGAKEQFEHVILEYPGSALVPQARRELDALPPVRANQ